MTMGTMTKVAAVLVALAPAAAVAQNNIAGNTTAPAPAPAPPPVADPEPLPAPRETEAPPPASEPVVTTVPAPAPTIEPLPDPAANPYANSYNEFLPLEEETEEEGFDWGLLGLLGLIGLFGLAGRRERVVYVERADHVVTRREPGEPL